MFRLLPLVIFLQLITSCAVNPVTGKKQFAVMSEAKEIAMGQAYDPQITASFGLYEDSVLQNYINAMGKEMGAISHRPKLNYTFRIMDSPVVNAFAVPGGYVYFTRGIMANFNNEAEFAGVLGHEIGHVTARHSVVAQRNAVMAQVGLIAGMIASPKFAEYLEPASTGVQLMLLKFGRDAESQSDGLGVEYSSRIGYNAHEMAEFFNTLSRQGGGSASRIPEFLSTHPDPLNRLENVHELATAWQEKLNLSDGKVGRDTYLRMLEGLVYGEDPRQGFVENSAFVHPELKIQFPVPNGWKHENTPQQFSMAPADGKALLFLAFAPGVTLQAASDTMARQYGLTVLTRNSRVINGFDALEMNAEQRQEAAPDQQQTAQMLKVKVTLYKVGESVLQITGVTEGTDLNTYQGEFTRTMIGFAPLTDILLLNKQPERLHVQRTDHAASLSQQLTKYGIPHDKLEEFAIVNGMELTDDIPSGTLIKVLKR
ncbi:MAG: M48 family metalloprotease [Flavobacteriales bacterium]|nr:M48 family metalloprotease [Flavobacteriales bacterium]